LSELEVLELQENQITSLPSSVAALSSLKVLNVSNNKLRSLPMAELATTSIVQLIAFKNQLSGTLFANADSGFSRLQQLDVSINSLSSFAENEVHLPALKELNLSFNRIPSLPSMQSMTSLATFLIQENKLSELPDGFTDLTECLRLVDLQGNDIAKLDPRIGKMSALDTLRVAANPIRERKFQTMGTAELKRDLRGRLGLDEEGEEVD
jgi:Leucine-rich repeat (LRR) protein